jgi:hypothetical protein
MGKLDGKVALVTGSAAISAERLCFISYPQRRGSFFLDPGEQPGLNRGGRPLLFRRARLAPRHTLHRGRRQRRAQ